MAHMCKNYLNIAIEIKCRYVANYIIIINCLKLLKWIGFKIKNTQSTA